MITVETNEVKIIAIGFALIVFVFSFSFLRPEKTEEVLIAETNYDYSFWTLKELQENLTKRKNITVLDIRAIEDYNHSRIIDSVHIPLEVLKGNINKLNPTDTIVVVWHYYDPPSEYSAVKILNEAGFADVYVLSGGFEAWEEKTYQTISLGDMNSFLDHAKIDFISAEDFNRLREENYKFFILDTRSASSYALEHIPGAINIPFDELENNRDMITRLHEVVVYGENSLESFQSGTRLFDLGFLNALVLDGGLDFWKESEYDIARQ